MKTIKVNSLREIDRLVAEHIFKWGLFTHPELGNKLTGLYNSKREEVPYYSTDISAAWQIIKQFQGSLHKLSKGYSAFIHIGKDSYFEDANTPELAICLAALRTKGIEVDLNELTL